MGYENPDIELIKKLQAGDKNALYPLYDKYSAAIYGVILRICKEEGLAEDLLQETFIKVWQKIGSYDVVKGRFYTWVYRIAKNTALNELRKKELLIQKDDLSVYTHRTTDEAPIEHITKLKGSLKGLEPHHQEALELVYFRGYTHGEAHEEMGVPLGTFKSYVRQAIKKLREGYAQLGLLIWIFLN